MKNTILFCALMCLLTIGCSSDPCEEVDNVECETGDVDGDGVLNPDDTAPLDPCVPDSNNLNCDTGDFDHDGTPNGEDSSPEDPCLPSDNLNCPTGDIDNDGTANSEDSDPEDPCLPNDNVNCPTGDVDGDGVINSEDIAPLDSGIPSAPPFSQNVIGKWSWDTFGASGIVELFEDGTYEETSGELISNGTVVERRWSIQNATTLRLEVTNSDGFDASINLVNKSFDCETMVFEGFISDVTFRRQ